HHRHLPSFPTRRSSDLQRCCRRQHHHSIPTHIRPSDLTVHPIYGRTSHRDSGKMHRCSPRCTPTASRTGCAVTVSPSSCSSPGRSEEHTSELQSPYDLV